LTRLLVQWPVGCAAVLPVARTLAVYGAELVAGNPETENGKR